MHEIGIASSIIESVAAEARDDPGAQSSPLACASASFPMSIKTPSTFAFDALTRDTEWEHLKFEIEWCPRRQKCLACCRRIRRARFQSDLPQMR